MASEPKKKIKYKGGYLRPIEGKTGTTYKAEIFLGGKQVQKRHKTQKQARDWIDTQKMQHDVAGRILTEEEIRDARMAFDILRGGMTLTEAARHAMNTHGGAVRPTKATEALEAMMMEKTSLDLRGRSLSSHQQRVGKFLRDFPGQEVHEFTTDIVQGWMTEQGYSGSTWNNYRRDLSNFFGWCSRHKMIGGNPAKEIPKSRKSTAPPQCFPVDAVSAFMVALVEHDSALVPYYATGFFAGARSAELGRMDASCFDDGLIHIGADQAKTRNQRFVTIQPNLAAWLEAYPPRGRLLVKNHRKRFEAVRRKCLVNDAPLVWVDNGARHSFASYHLAAYQDAAKTAHELGHPNASLLFSTYRTLAKQADGVEYFKIVPKNK